MSKKTPGIRKILFLSGKSFLLLRKKDLQVYYYERPLHRKSRVVGVTTPAGTGRIMSDARELFIDKYRDWKKLFIFHERKP